MPTTAYSIGEQPFTTVYAVGDPQWMPNPLPAPSVIPSLNHTNPALLLDRLRFELEQVRESIRMIESDIQYLEPLRQAEKALAEAVERRGKPAEPEKADR